MMQFRGWLVGLAVLGGTAAAEAQTGDLMVQRDAGGLYLNHQVAPKENFYSIGRLFNISPKVIAPFNGLALNGGLSIGQVIKIPLKDQNYTAVKKKDAPSEVLVPVYRLAAGKKVLAGFLKVNKGESPLAAGGPAISHPATETTEAPAVARTTPVKQASPAPAQQDVPAPAPAQALAKQETASANQETVPASWKSANNAAAQTSAATDPLAGPTDQPAKPVRKKKPVQTPPVVASTPVPTPETTAVAPSGAAHYSGEGAFHPDYLTQTDEGRKTRNENGLAGVFKSTSGWDNGKYYALMKGVGRGTVVKVTNLSNNKVVFVKVLGDIADIKQNTGMLIVLSDAAVSQLGATTDRFTASLSYAK